MSIKKWAIGVPTGIWDYQIELLRSLPISWGPFQPLEVPSNLLRSLPISWGPFWPLEVPSNPSNSVILWFYAHETLLRGFAAASGQEHVAILGPLANATTTRAVLGARGHLGHAHVPPPFGFCRLQIGQITTRCLGSQCSHSLARY